MVIVHEDQLTHLIIPRSVLLRMRNVSEKKIVGEINTHILFSFITNLMHLFN